MSATFVGILVVVIYLDDIVVHGLTTAIHDKHLTSVLDVLASHNFTLGTSAPYQCPPLVL